MNTEKEHVVTEIYYPLGIKVPYVRRTGKPLQCDDPELQTCGEGTFSLWLEKTSVPESLAGFQCIENGHVKRGDLLVHRIDIFWADDFYIGLHSNSVNLGHYSVYRKLPVANHAAIAAHEVKALIEEHKSTCINESGYRPLGPGEEPQHGDEVLYRDKWVESEFIGEPSDALRKVTRTKRPKPNNPAPAFYPNQDYKFFLTATNHDPKGEEGKKKPQLQLIPPVFNIQVAGALAFGAAKYEPWNWRKNKVEYMTYLGAMKRHIDALLEREDVASDSGVHHLGHIAASCAIVLDATKHGTLVDNRPPARFNSEPVVDNGAYKGVE